MTAEIIVITIVLGVASTVIGEFAIRAIEKFLHKNNRHSK